MAQVCQADHNVVFTALGEEQTDYGERDAEDGDGGGGWGSLRVQLGSECSIDTPYGKFYE